MVIRAITLPRSLPLPPVPVAKGVQFKDAVVGGSQEPQDVIEHLVFGERDLRRKNLPLLILLGWMSWTWDQVDSDALAVLKGGEDDKLAETVNALLLFPAISESTTPVVLDPRPAKEAGRVSVLLRL